MHFKRLRVLRRIMKETHASNIWYAFLICFFICALLIWLLEPDIKTYGEALWYCYAVVTTIGFGDLTVHSVFSKIISVFLSIYAAIVIAIVTGVIVNFFNELVALRRKESLESLIEKLKVLPELSKEELEEISERIKKLN
jgi:voltage-gated potassium channel